MKRAKGLLNKIQLKERLKFFFILNDMLGAKYDLRTNSEIKNGTPLVKFYCLTNIKIDYQNLKGGIISWIVIIILALYYISTVWRNLITYNVVNAGIDFYNKNMIP